MNVQNVNIHLRMMRIFVSTWQQFWKLFPLGFSTQMTVVFHMLQWVSFLSNLQILCLPWPSEKVENFLVCQC